MSCAEGRGCSRDQLATCIKIWPWTLSDICTMRTLKCQKWVKLDTMDKEDSYGGKQRIFTSCCTKEKVAVIMACDAMSVARIAKT
jgi:hypothetical protein